MKSVQNRNILVMEKFSPKERKEYFNQPLNHSDTNLTGFGCLTSTFALLGWMGAKNQVTEGV